MSDEMVEDQVDEILDEPAMDGEPAQSDSFIHTLTSQAPWWLVSVVFHVLLIVLAYMMSIAYNLDTEEREPLVTVTTLTRPENPVDDKKPKEEMKTALMSDRDTHPTDPTSKEMSNIEVPPDILKKAEIGDHFETINLDRPDTHSAFGTPDAHMFHSVKGSDDAAGGGGSGGATLEDVIGAGSARSPGSGGGWGGGKGTGIGNDTGSGRGSFGNRGGGGRKLMVKRHGGSKATENSVDAALHWLAYHQEADGHWDCKKYAGEAHDDAVTGLALLAFLGAGHSEKVGEYKDNVRRAVEWLKSQQKPNGAMGASYAAAITSMAMAEAAAMANVPATRDAAQKAINYCTEVHQAGEGSDKMGWRYGPKSEGDTSVTGWFIMALKSAKVAGLHVNPASFDGAIKYLDSVEHKQPGGDPGYAPASTYSYMAKNAGGSHRLTAIGCLCRQFMGWKKEDLQASVEGFVAKGGVPAWEGNGDRVDLYYWYYGTLCVFQQGGDLWKRWNDATKTALTTNQRKEGDDQGSWDPVGAYSKQWGRVGETAIGTLCLEVYYRYQKLDGGN